MITEHGGRDGPGHARPAAAVLTDRIAAALMSRDAGWQLPRHTDLARRYGTSTAEIEAAIRELTRRHLVRRLPDGRLYRASPAEYLVTFDGLADAGVHIDPMGASITCASRHVSRRRIPADIGSMLGLSHAGEAIEIRCVWTADGDRAALSTTYLPGAGAGPREPGASSLEDTLNFASLASMSAARTAVRAQALHVEIQPPAPSAARTLRLAPGVSALTVTVRFSGAGPGSPTALTAAVLRPDLFKITIEAAAVGPPVTRPREPGGTTGWTAKDEKP